MQFTYDETTIPRDQNKNVSATKLLIISGILLIVGHLLLQQYMPNVAVGGLGYILFFRNNIFGFIMIIYICSHFSYGDGHGGLWNIVAFTVLSLYFLAGRQKPEIRQPNGVIKLLLTTFIFFNIIGWLLKNPMPILPLVKGSCAFMGYMLIYSVASKIEITAARVRIFLSITFFLLLYQVAVSLIQYYSLLNITSPLVGGNTLEMDKIPSYSSVRHEPLGTIGHFELCSEYALLMICISIPLLSSSTTRTELKFNYVALSIMIFACISIIILTSMRGAFILAVLVTTFYYIVFSLRIFNSIDNITQQIKIILLVIFLLPAVSVYIGIKEFEKDFSRLDTKKMNVENVVSGKSINRGGLADYALDRMNSESWFIGYGSGTVRSNQWAWFGFDPTKRESNIADFHNLYVSLPMVYGWIGSFAFIGIIVVTFFRLLSVTLKYRKKRSFLLVLSFGLTIMWGAFMAHEYKISILRNANYQMLFWIWLGLSASVVKTIKEKWQFPNKSEYLLNTPSINQIKTGPIKAQPPTTHENPDLYSQPYLITPYLP
jgi:O-Antigen ligase